MSRQKPRWAEMLVAGRKDAKLSSDELADKLKLGRSTIRQAEAGYESKAVMERLHLVLPDQAPAIVAEHNAYWDRRGQASAKIDSADTPAIVSKRLLGVVKPNGKGRKYTSVDDVMLTITGSEAVADFTRLFPLKQDRGRTWTARGEVMSRHGELRMFFDPSGEDRQDYDSSGCFFFVPRDLESSRLSYYKGIEVRGVDVLGGREPDVRELDLYPPAQLPSEYMPAFAVLDLDNTLFNGWSILKWVENSLYLHDREGLDDLRRLLLQAHEAYVDENEPITHDEFALRAGQAYTEFFNHNEPTRLRQAASAFAGQASTQACWSTFAADLVQALRQMMVAPVLITGAPQELAIELASVIGITEVYGFDAAHPTHPNSGTAKGKMQLAHRIAEKTTRSLQFAAGDSESDALVLAASPARLVASKLLELRPDLKSHGSVFDFNAETPSEAITSWVKDILPEPALSRREAEAQAPDN